MSRYAARVEDGTVVQAIVGEVEWAASRLGGVWLASDTKVGVGWTWDGSTFRPPQPYPSWTWDGTAWQPPVPYLGDGEYEWDEASSSWLPVEEQ